MIEILMWILKIIGILIVLVFLIFMTLYKIFEELIESEVAASEAKKSMEQSKLIRIISSNGLLLDFMDREDIFSTKQATIIQLQTYIMENSLKLKEGDD